MPDISNLIDNARNNARTNGFKFVQNENSLCPGARKYWLMDPALKGYEGTKFEALKPELALAYSAVMLEAIQATKKSCAQYPEKIELLDEIKERYLRGEKIIITAEGTINEFAV